MSVSDSQTNILFYAIFSGAEDGGQCERNLVILLLYEPRGQDRGGQHQHLQIYTYLVDMDSFQILESYQILESFRNLDS